MMLVAPLPKSAINNDLRTVIRPQDKLIAERTRQQSLRLLLQKRFDRDFEKVQLTLDDVPHKFSVNSEIIATLPCAPVAGTCASR